MSLLDVEALANQVGLAAWFDRSQYMTARLPFASRFVPLYAEHVTRLIAAIRGQSRKVLVLDLDNTLWGGVVGDDGIDGIRLGQGDPRGEASSGFAARRPGAETARHPARRFVEERRGSGP